MINEASSGPSSHSENKLKLEKLPVRSRILDKLTSPFSRPTGAPLHIHNFLKSGSDSERAERKSVKASYTTLQKNLAAFDTLIPEYGLEIFGEGIYGKRISKEKQLNVDRRSKEIRDSLQEHFPDSSEQLQILDAANGYLGRIITNIAEVNDYETTHLGEIDVFLTDFPEKVLTQLDKNATVPIVKRLFTIGTQLLDRYCDEAVDGEDRNYAIRKITVFIGKELPTILGKAGNQYEQIFQKIGEVMPTLSHNHLLTFGNYLTEYLTPTPEEEKEKIQKLKEKLATLYPDSILDNPLRQDKEPWNIETHMGHEKRKPTWGDIAAVVLNTENINNGIGDKEYGLRVIQSADGPIIEYLRGDNGIIKNRTKFSNEKRSIFFHTHPSYAISLSEINAPIVSIYDLDRTLMADYGGGVLNVACADGMTFHLGSKFEDTPMPETYTIESGNRKGAIFSKEGKETSDATNIKQEMKDSGEPYVFSIKKGKRQYFFAHFPWEKIDPSIDFYDVCLGGGLPKLLEGMSDLPDIPIAQNLQQAISQTKRL